MLAKIARVLRREGPLGLLRAAQFRVAEATNARVVRSLYGPKFVGNWGDQTFRFYAVGAYGREYASFVKGIAEPFTYLDIGANQGLYSILASQNPRSVGVHAFEPVPSTASLLRQNIELNACKNVSVHEVAVSDNPGTAEIAVSNGHSGAATLRNGAVLSGKDDHTFTIRCVDHTFLDDLLGEADTPVHIKIDVEGHELQVIDQLARCRARDRFQSVFFECDEAWFDPEVAKEKLASIGFSGFERRGGRRHYDILATRTSSNAPHAP